MTRQPEDPGHLDVLAWSYSDLGHALDDTGRTVEAAEADRKSIAIWESLAAREPHVTAYRQGLAWGYKHLGELIRDAGRPAEAANLFEKAITTAEALTVERPDDPGFSRNLDMCYQELGKLLPHDPPPDGGGRGVQEVDRGRGAPHLPLSRPSHVPT